MKIQELAEQTGLTADTIRYYEKEGLLDHRHLTRDRNNYRNYTGDAVARLALIKKLQSVGFSLAELRETLNEPVGDPATNQRVIEQIRNKIDEIKRKKEEYDRILDTLAWMLEYRLASVNDPKKAESLLRQRRAEAPARREDARDRTAHEATGREY